MTDKLAAEALKSDPRIAQAKELLFAAVREHQKNITQIRPPQTSLKQSYDELLKQFADLRGNKLWLPYIGSGIGNKALVELLDGSVKYDFISGIGVHHFGRHHPGIMEAIIDSALSDVVMQGHLQQNADVLSLSALLCKASKIDHCFLTSSGAMANENALKIIFQKKFPANRILAFEHCFAGRTWSLAQITDKPSFREGLPSTVFVDYIPFYDAKHPRESTEKAISVLKHNLERHPKQYAMMIFELVQGEAGFNPGTHEFFSKLMQIVRENNIAVFVDEVQTFGRLSKLFAYQHFDLDQYVDVVTIGKLSLTCATLFRKEFAPKAGLLSQTYISSTAAIQAAQFVIQELLSVDYFGPKGKNMRIYEQFSQHLGALAKKYPDKIAGPFGIGAMIAFTPFDGTQQRTTKFVHDLFERGVISFIAGDNPTRARFLVPAGAVTENDIDAVTKIIEETIAR